ncbi:SWI/SNF complex subunit SWI3D [Benincasa hispida]|uniref:SWI/SNF complex subunit SWI3D n=1 Tax=Benincasa hispida TaxID=102211 RepID=UPI0019000994|nr:SWI/SNF complex subunit SWI3D [Benincasa hispida]
MEEKRRDSGNLPANTTDSPSSEPPSSRRRAGAHKRKASALSGSNSSSGPSKRVTRDKSALSHPPNHSGPFTRARLGPNNGAGAASANAAGGFAAGSVKAEGSLFHSEVQRGDALVAAAEELNKASRLANLEASFETDFEVIKSRGANVHVVPNHCGWFSWTKVHPIEESTMPTFFSGKAGTRSPNIYIEIRNWIMKKFHANPSTQIESKALSELEIGELDARQEVMEFLDHWGLINFHPFLAADSISTNDADNENQKDSLVEKLFHFETLESCPSIVPKINATTAAPPRLLRESAISEEMVRPEGPSVEYHCNSCSADCSRKRYHCQKQADFDLCSECFNNGKFDSDMSSSDFILMESAEVPGASGGKWTDQETLLLLEALELYKENWNEIAEHVATKTKAQCILHFIQMPIEDTFLEYEGNVEVSAKETIVPPLIENDSSVPSDITESMDNKATGKEASNVESASKEDTGEVKVGQDNSKSEDVEGKASLDNSKSEDGDQKVSEDIALNALREAFEAIGYILTPEHSLSFADVGNPVMALAAFLARLVGPDVASASARFSLKSISQKSPSLELATRHCFILEDPPDDKKAQVNSESIDDVEAQKNDKEQCAKQREDNSTSLLDDRALSTNNSNNKSGESVIKETTENGNSSDAIGEHNPVINHGSDTSNLKKLGEPELPKDEKTGIVKESKNLESKLSSNPVEKVGEGTPVEKPSQSTLSPKDVHMSDSQHAESSEIQKQVPSRSAKTTKELDDETNRLPSGNEPQVIISANSVKEASYNVAMLSDSHDKNEPGQTETSKSVVDHGATKVSDSLSSAVIATPQPVEPNSVVERGADDNQSKDNKEENSNSTSKKEEKVDKLKRAAVTTLSAAAVKAKILANQEEDQIRQLAMILIEKQLHKLESKLAFFNEMDNVTMRVREQLDRSKQRLFQERAQIIAARLGLPASSSRGVAPTLPANRMAMNFANSAPRPPMGMMPQRPPTSGPSGMAATNPNPQYATTSTTISGNSFRPANQDTLSSVGTK